MKLTKSDKAQGTKSYVCVCANNPLGVGGRDVLTFLVM